MKSPCFHFITLFPAAVETWLKTSILGRAHERGLFQFELHDLRAFGQGSYRVVDDTPYGGGGGMVLKVEPLVDAVEKIKAANPGASLSTLYFSPAGKPLSQALIEELQPKTRDSHYILICGHYEGVDQRFIDHWVDVEISLGDFVLTGGELPAVAFADAMIRRIEGALGDTQAIRKESFTLKSPEGSMLLEYPHYTRPPEFRGHRVPDVLLSGDHGKIETWRREQALFRTQKARPDLLKKN